MTFRKILKSQLLAIYHSSFAKKIRLDQRDFPKRFYQIMQLAISMWTARPLIQYSKRHQLSYEKLSNYTYGQFYEISKFNVDYFNLLAKRMNKIRIKALQNKDKIRVGFYLHTSSMWSCSELYTLLEKDDRFEPFIIIPGPRDGLSEETWKETYNLTLEYFKKNGYRTIGCYDYEYQKDVWRDIIKVDIIFILTPYINRLPVTFSLSKIPLNVLSIYIHYGMSVTDNVSGWDTYNHPGMVFAWKYFCDTKEYVQKYTKESITNGDNIVYSGHPKMDTFYDSSFHSDSNYIWKTATNNADKVTKIIYAPHHSLGNSGMQYSTFDKNYQFMYQYAKSHSNDTSWIIKPHPNLKQESVRNGVFSSPGEYDHYLDMWDQLPNARAIRDGPYFEVFKYSDGLILDSSSFLMEYQYTQKPLLFLTRNGQNFTELAHELLSISYTAPGNDFDTIAKFINDILIDKNDYLKADRELFFKKHLDYVGDHDGDLASEYIYKYLKNELNK